MADDRGCVICVDVQTGDYSDRAQARLAEHARAEAAIRALEEEIEKHRGG